VADQSDQKEQPEMILFYKRFRWFSETIIKKIRDGWEISL